MFILLFLKQCAKKKKNNNNRIGRVSSVPDDGYSIPEMNEDVQYAVPDLSASSSQYSGHG